MRFNILIITAFAFCGCVSVDRDALNAQSSLRTGNDAEAAKWSAKLADNSTYSSNLGTVEAGRVAFLGGSYNLARERFLAAVNSAVDKSESAPKLKATDMFNTAIASTITDDRTREYYLAPYEVNMAIGYSMLSHLFSGRRDGALVDARLAVYVQDALSNALGADMAKEQSGMTPAARSVVNGQNAALEEMIASTRNSWENPVLWWLTGVLFEADADIEMARQSYLKASAVSPGCPFFSADVSRLSGPISPQKDKAKLVVVYEQDFVPVRQSVKVPVPVYTGLSIDLPTYRDEAFVSEIVSVGCAGAESMAYPALSIRSLAARDLKEKLPGIVVRNITRATVQVAAQAAANNSGNSYAQIAVLAGNALLSAVRRSDTRSWITLPAVQHVWSNGALQPGVHDVAIKVNGVPFSAKVSLAAGETKLLYVAKTGSVVRGGSVSLTKSGAQVFDINGKEIGK